MIPSEVTTALRTLSSAFGNSAGRVPDAPSAGLRQMPGRSGALPAGEGGATGGEPGDDGKPGTAPEPDAADAKPGADMLPKAA